MDEQSLVEAIKRLEELRTRDMGWKIGSYGSNAIDVSIIWWEQPRITFVARSTSFLTSVELALKWVPRLLDSTSFIQRVRDYADADGKYHLSGIMITPKIIKAIVNCGERRWRLTLDPITEVSAVEELNDD